MLWALPFLNVQVTGWWYSTVLCSIGAAVSATLIALLRRQPPLGLLVAAITGSATGALFAIGWSEILTSGPPWQHVSFATPPPWMPAGAARPVVVSMLVSAALAVVLPRASVGGNRWWRTVLNRTSMTLALTLVTALGGSIALGDGIASANHSTTTTRLAVSAGPGVDHLGVVVTIGGMYEPPDGGPAFVEGGVNVSATVTGRAGEVAEVLLLTDDFLAWSPWVSNSVIETVLPSEWTTWEPSGESCQRSAGGRPGEFDSYDRGLVVGIPILADGTGIASVDFTAERRWWNASGDRSEVWLPRVSLEGPACTQTPVLGASRWSAPARWSLSEAPAQAFLAPGDEVIEPLGGDGVSGLFGLPPASDSATSGAQMYPRQARWATSSDVIPSTTVLQPMYKLVTAHTRSRASTMTFVAALLWGLTLTGVFELVRGATPSGSRERGGDIASRREEAPSTSSRDTPRRPTDPGHRDHRKRSPRADRSGTSGTPRRFGSGRPPFPGRETTQEEHDG